MIGARDQERPQGLKGRKARTSGGARTRAARRRYVASLRWPGTHLVGPKILQGPEPLRTAQVVENRPEQPRAAFTGLQRRWARILAARRRDIASLRWPGRHLVGSKVLQGPKPSRTAQVVEDRPEWPRAVFLGPQEGTEGNHHPVTMSGVLTGPQSREVP